MLVSRSLSLLVCLMSFLVANAQEIPPLHNFSPLDYSAGNQNWGISQSQDQLIYVANNEGLLEFDGSAWTLHPSPNQTIIRSVSIIDDKIYTGCYMEFGFWERDNLGVLNYRSISQHIDVSLIEDEEFWKIIGVDDWVVFQSLKRIYLFNKVDKAVRVIDSEAVINKMFTINDEVLFQRLEAGIYRIENGEAEVFIDDPQINQSEVINMLTFGNGILIITRNNGFFFYQDNQLRVLQQLDLRNMGVYSALRLSDGKTVLGTISNGLVILDPSFEILYTINQNNGLINNTVLSLFEDVDQNIWAGLDNGVTCININAPIKIFKDTKGVIGSVYASAIFQGNLYLGTNQGLFVKQLGSDEAFKIIQETQGQVWCLNEIDGELFCGHHLGTFLIEGRNAKRITEIQGTWNVTSIENTDLLIQGNYDGLYTLEKSLGSWRLKGKLEGFNNSSRYFEVLGDKIFVNHEYKGVFKLTVDKAYSRVIDSNIDTTLKEANSSIAKYRGEILYVAKGSIMVYDEAQQTFVKDSLLSTTCSPEDYISGRIVVDNENDRFWLFTKTNLVLVTTGSLSRTPKINRIPVSLEMRRAVSEYENMISIVGDQERFLLGTSSGYMMLDIEELGVSKFDVFLKEISVGINEDHSAAKNLVDQEIVGSFDSNENNLFFRFNTPKYYEYFKPTFQYKLVGLYDQWSEWTSQSYVSYQNIPPGDYTFLVRSRVGNQLSENTASFQFFVSKPWYLTDVMIGIYLALLIMTSLLIHQFYKRYYRRQQEKLIEKNQNDLQLTMLQKEREIINLKNEQLEKDFRRKSNEAAASAMSIVKKNELLMQIKEHLDRIDDQADLNPVIKIIDRNLNHDENWKLFKKAFDDSDSEFFKKVKESHPELSPNDLKLCAYLRLNLSSKEIAPLFNISPRSVEIKRYRLRQKMELKSDENLTEYILSM